MLEPLQGGVDAGLAAEAGAAGAAEAARATAGAARAAQAIAAVTMMLRPRVARSIALCPLLSVLGVPNQPQYDKAATNIPKIRVGGRPGCLTEVSRGWPAQVRFRDQAGLVITEVSRGWPARVRFRDQAGLVITEGRLGDDA